jgi:hypothetical protein
MLLQTCRFEGGGETAYGREAVGERLNGRDLDLADAWFFEHPRHAVVLGSGWAAFADLYDDWIGRLWLVSELASCASPPPMRIDVPVDPDLSQGARGLRFDPLDHPALDEGVDTLAAEAARWPRLELQRVRPLILRAASARGSRVALVRLEGEASDSSSTPIGCNAVLAMTPEGAERRIDKAALNAERRRSWSPRL